MNRDPETTRKVEAVRDLLTADSSLSTRKACDRVGINESSFRYRVKLDGVAPRGISGGDLGGVHQPGDLDSPDAEITVITRDFTDESVHHMYPLGDLHKGSPAHARAKWRQWLGYFGENPAASLAFTGDGLNAALTTSVSDTYAEVKTVPQARRELQDEFRPLAERDQLDLLLPGNHEWRCERATDEDPIGVIAEVLGLEDRYARDAALLRYQVGDFEYKVFVAHGTRGGRRAGGRANALEDMQDVIDADVYVQAHAHTQMSFKQQKFVFVPSEERVERRTRYFVGSGSFLGYESYAARGLYRPTAIGAPRIRFDGRRFDVHVSI